MKRIYKILFFILSFFIILFCFAIIAFYSSSVQTYITKKISNYYSEKLKTKITVESVDLDFFNSFILNKIYAEDEKSDTLLYIQSLKVEIDSFNLSENNFYLKNVHLINPVIKIKSDSAGNYNYDFLIDYFSSENTNDDTSVNEENDYNIFCKNFTFENSSVLINTNSKKSSLNKKDEFNPNNIYLKNLNIKLKNIKFNKEISCDIVNLSLEDKCGFKIDSFSCSSIISNKNIKITNLYIKTPKSKIYPKKILLLYKEYKSLNNFLTDVKTIVDFDSSLIHSSDISFFYPKLKNLNTEFSFSLKAKSESNNINSKELKFYIYKNTEVNMSLNLSNIQNSKNIFINANIKKIKTDKNDLNNLPLENFIGEVVKIPNEISGLKSITLSGKISGSINEIFYKGNIETNTGNLTAEINYKKNTKINTQSISGKIQSYNYKIRSLTGYKNFKNASFNISLNTKFRNSKLTSFSTKIRLSKFDFYNYTYKNITIFSDLRNKIIHSEIAVNDSNSNFNLKINYNFSKKLPTTLFSGIITKINLDKLNLDTSRNNPSFKGSFAGEITGNDIDNITGFLGINNLEYKTKGELLPMKSFIAESKNEYGQRIITIESDYLDADIRGTYKFKTLKHAFKKFISEYIPAYSEEWDPKLLEEDKKRIINLTFDFKNLGKVNKLLFKNINISDSTHIEAYFRTNDATLDFFVKIPEIKINNDRIKNFEFKAYTRNKLLNIETNAQILIPENNFKIVKIFYKGVINNNNVSSMLSWFNSDSLSYGGDIMATTNFSNKNNKTLITTKIEPTEQMLAGTVWNVNGDTINYNGDNIKVNGISLQNGQQRLKIYGKISDNPNDILNIEISNLDINRFNIFTGLENLKFNGRFTGNILAYNLLKNPKFGLICFIRDFKVNDESFGDLSLTAEKDTVNELFNIDAYALNGENRFTAQGTISDVIEINAAITKLNLKVIQPLLGEGITIKSGTMTGSAQIYGKPDNLSWTGMLNLKNAETKINYLDADFKLSSLIAIDNKSLQIALTDIYDSEGNKAVFSAIATHNNLNDFNFDIDFETERFLVLNTKNDKNENYFGKIYTSGVADIKGNLSEIYVKASMKTLKGSQLFLLSTNSELTDESDFMKFNSGINTDTIELAELAEENKKYTGLNLDFDLSITPETKLELIIDEASDNAISAQGEGNLNFKTDVFGNMDISGDYVLSRGKYEFNIKKLYNMEFNVKPGSVIQWNGSPDDANIDITAIYKIRKVELYNLLLEEYSKNMFVPVNCNIILSNKLLKPKIKFGVDVLGRNTSVQSMINNMSEDDINKQFLSLLILNSFQPLPGTSNQEKGADETKVNVAEILAGQVGSLLSAFNENIEVGVRYNQQNGSKSDEIQVDFSTSILDDRIIINGAVAKGEYRNSTNDIVGDFEAEIKMTEDGKFKMKVFNKSNKDLINETGPYTQGIAFFFRKSFDKIFQNKRKKIKQKRN